MKRREFLAMAAVASVGSPLGAQAQKMPVIGYLHAASAKGYETFVAAFRAGLKEIGYVERENVTIEFRWAEGHYDRLPELAAELARLHPALIVAGGGGIVAKAAHAADPTISIVFTSGGDPIREGLVASLNHPGGEITGVLLITNSLVAKRVELLRELLPKADTVALLSNPTGPLFAADLSDAQEAARAQDLKLLPVNARSNSELDAAFVGIAAAKAQGLVVEASPVFTSERTRFVSLAQQYAIPTVFEWPDFATAGGLMSYGADLADGYRQAGVYAGRILKGEKPRDLPVVQSAKIKLVVNLKTAKALGLTIPQSILARADEVIE